MQSVSHSYPISATPHGATGVDMEELKDELADAMMVALNHEDWAPYNQASAAWFFAVASMPTYARVVRDC